MLAEETHIRTSVVGIFSGEMSGTSSVKQREFWSGTARLRMAPGTSATATPAAALVAATLAAAASGIFLWELL